MIKLNTKLLFYQLLRALRPATVYDVGSLDGTHSVRFRRILPGARIVAFEANPRNVEALRSDETLRRCRIELVPQAVSDQDGTVEFHVEALSEHQSWRQGISSTRRRTTDSLGSTPAAVESIRLDTFTHRRADHAGPIAAWIDVEGSSYEVLKGMEGIQGDVLMLHVEVETRELWHGQHLKPDVEALMRAMSFTAVARGFVEDQHDLVCIRADTLREHWVKIRLAILRTLVLTYAQMYLGNAIFRSLGNLYLRYTGRGRR